MQKELIAQLINAELEDANKKHFDYFRSPHEGYAVILEEVEEVEDSVKLIREQLNSLWGEIKNDDVQYQTKMALIMKGEAKNLIAEATQVAAMCQKFINSMEEK